VYSISKIQKDFEDYINENAKEGEDFMKDIEKFRDWLDK